MLIALAMVTPTASQAQQYYASSNDQVVAAAPLPQAQLDALLAPIARGLGLAIVKSIADRHLATIELDSGPGGRGLAVRVSFPM